MANQTFLNRQSILSRLAVAIGLTGSALLLATANNALALEPEVSLNQPASVAVPNGVYLFGESPEPEQVGSAYMVFEVQDSQVVGGFYMPYSSFDCFQGEFVDDRLSLNVVNSYDLTSHTYSLLVDANAEVADANSDTGVPIELVGYHEVPTVSDNDMRILETCKAGL